MDRIDRCIDRTRRNPEYLYAILFLDIDRFKEVNDSHGHTLGDQFLITIANRLQSCLRKSDALDPAEGRTVARIGGDEFVVLLDGIQEPADALLVAERIQESLADPIVLEGVEFFTSASIGIATSDLSYRSPDDLLRDADAAMYSAKAAGKARHEMFNERMHAEVKARLKLGNDLRRGASTTRSSAPTTSPSAPSTPDASSASRPSSAGSIPSAASSPPPSSSSTPRKPASSSSSDAGSWARPAASSATWQDRFELPDLTMSVNVSMHQASRPTLVNEVQQIMEASQVPRGCLKLEITESVIMGNMETITEVLSKLRDLGVEVHMDDFGTGYSSLSYLHRFPLDALKIDRTFLSATKSDHDYAGIVKTVVTLAHHLDMRVTVEGVETPDQFALLQTLGADHAQGYYFAEPLDAEAATELLAANPSWTLGAEAAYSQNAAPPPYGSPTTVTRRPNGYDETGGTHMIRTGKNAGIAIEPYRVHDIIKRYQCHAGFMIVPDLEQSQGSWMHDALTGEDFLDAYTSFASWPIGYNHPAMADPQFRHELMTAAPTKISNSDLYTCQMADFVEAFSTRVTPDGFPHHFWISGGALAVENALKAAFDWKARKLGRTSCTDDGNDLVVAPLPRAPSTAAPATR